MKSGWLALLVILSLGLGVAHAATVQWLDLKELSARSSVVFVGEVVQQRTRLAGPPHQVFTQTAFVVEEVLKGSLPARWTLEQLGGVSGEGQHRLEQRVPGYARFTVGERVVLFLERADTDVLVVTGLAQGKYRLKDQQGQTVAVRNMGGLEFVGETRAADLHLAGVPRNADRLPYAQLREIIEGHAPTPVPLRVIRPGVDDRPTGGHNTVRGSR